MDLARPEEGVDDGTDRHRAPLHRRHGGPAAGQAPDRAALPRRGGRARRRGLQLPARRRRRHEHGRRLRDVELGARLRRLRDEARPRHAAAGPVARGHGAADGRPRVGGRHATWSPRRARSCAGSSRGSPSAAGPPRAGTELEFIVFRDSYEDAWHKGYRDLEPANLYNVDYSMLGTARVEPLIRRIRNSMMAAGHVGRELEGRVQLRPARDQLPLRRARSPTADDHVIYKNGAKEIAAQEGMSITFMAKFDEREGNSCHIHCSLAKDDGGGNVFADDETDLRPLRRRPARRAARADAVVRPARQLLQALRGGLVRADRGRLGPRQPHLLDARRRPRPGRCGSRTGCPAPTSTRTWRSRR